MLRAKTIILACGVSWRRLTIEGFDRLAGKGVFYGAARSEASNTHGLDVHIIGAGNSAGQAAMFFSTHARTVTILYRGDGLEKSMSRYLIDQIAARLQHPRADPRGSGGGVRRHLAEGDRRARQPHGGDDAAGVRRRVHLHRRGRRDGLAPQEIALDRRGYVLTGPDVAAAGAWTLERDPYLLETSVPGVFACGDVRSGPVKRVAAAVGEGSMAIAFVHQYLKEQEAPAPTP